MSQMYTWPSESAAANASVGANGQSIPGSSTLVAGENPSGDLQPLQTDVAGALFITGTVTIGGLANPLPVQDAAAEASLASIDSKLNSLGQKTMANSMPVAIASDQSAIPVTAASLPLPTGAATEATLAALNAKFNTLGQKTSANSAPVVLASDQSAIPVSQSGVWSTGRTWALSSGTDSVAAVQSGTWNINNISGTISLPTGASTAANQATGNASLASIDSKLNSLGQKTMANSAPVVIASDQSPVAISAASLPLPSGAATEATLSAFSAKSASAFVTDPFDYQLITYVPAGPGAGQIDTVTWKLGGAGGSTVASVTLAYDGSDRLSTVTWA